jgi:transcription initiation factor TFIIE subunit alpha
MIADPIVHEVITGITNDEENSFCIIECMLNGQTTDEEIAEKTEIRLNIVRRVLYKLYDAGIATYKRSKDPETQWYTYSWKFEQNRVSDIIDKKHDKLSRELRESLEYEEENIFFICADNGCRYNFDEASEKNFECPECGCPMEYQDNSDIILRLKDLKKKLND